VKISSPKFDSKFFSELVLSFLEGEINTRYIVKNV